MIWLGVIGGMILLLVLFQWWVTRDAAAWQEQRERQREELGARNAEYPWEELFERADGVLKETVASLPPELRKEADKLPCILRKWPAEESDGVLGHYLGFEEGMVSEAYGPVILYVGEIFRFSQEEKAAFEDEVRLTYLHEFGHHLGWDEDEIEKRGLT